MTVFWVDLLPGLQGVLTSLAIENTDPLWLAQGTEWKQQAHAFVSPDTAVQIDLKIASTGEGEFETRYVPFTDPTTHEVSQRAVYTGFRSFVLNVQCKGYQAEFAKWALVYAERLRTNLRRNTVADRISDQLGVDFFKFGPINDVDGVEDGHALTIVNFDVFGYASFSDDPSTAEIVPLFTSITITSKITGDTVGAPPNFTAEIPSDPL